MMRKILFYCAFTILSMGLVFIYSCNKKDAEDIDAVNSEVQKIENALTSNSNCEPEVVNLLAGKDILIGSLTVSNDDENLYVTYNTSSTWVIKETHLFAGGDTVDISSIPVNNGGNPKVGHYPYKNEHDNVNEYTYTISLDDIPLDVMLISAQAEVINSETSEEEGAWAEGIEFPGGNWAMYFPYQVQTCVPGEENLIYTEDDQEIDFNGKNLGGNLNLNLLITTSDDKYLEVDMMVDVVSSGYKLNINSTIKEKAAELLDANITIEDANNAISLLQGMIEKYVDNEGTDELAKEEIQGLFYYSSVFKTIKRYHTDMEENGVANLECTTYNGSIGNLSPYYAKEDIVIDLDDFRAYLQDSPTRLTEEDVEFIISTLNSHDGNNINLKDYETKIEDAISRLSPSHDRQVGNGGSGTGGTTTGGGGSGDDCFILCGTDCGCCMNYEGQCYFGAGICYIHDYFCQECTPRWFCFDGCKPTPCK